MGKAKRRGFNLKVKKTYTNISRKEAIEEVIELLKAEQDASFLISLFGLTLEEMLESGAEYEFLIDKFSSPV